MSGTLILLGIAAAGAVVWHVKGDAPWERRVDPGPPIPGRQETPIPIFAGDTADEYIAVLGGKRRAADPWPVDTDFRTSASAAHFGLRPGVPRVVDVARRRRPSVLNPRLGGPLFPGPRPEVPRVVFVRR